MKEQEAKAKAFDEVYEQVKFWRKQTNIQEWRNALDKVIEEFDWQYVRMSKTNRCLICNKPLDRPIWEWAYRKEIRWFCGTCYANFSQVVSARADEKELNELLNLHRRSFVLMMRKVP